MSPQWNQKEFDFGTHFGRHITVRFDGGRIRSNGGAVLLREVDQTNKMK